MGDDTGQGLTSCAAPGLYRPASHQVRLVDEIRVWKVTAVGRQQEERPQVVPELIETSIETRHPVLGDHLVVEMSGVSPIESDQTSIKGTMMQRAKGNSVAGFVRAVGMGGRKDMRGVEELQLNAAHGATMTIGGEDSLPEVDVAQDPPRGHDGVLTFCRNFASNFVVADVVRILSNPVAVLDRSFDESQQVRFRESRHRRASVERIPAYIKSICVPGRVALRFPAAFFGRDLPPSSASGSSSSRFHNILG